MLNFVHSNFIVILSYFFKLIKKNIDSMYNTQAKFALAHFVLENCGLLDHLTTHFLIKRSNYKL